MGRRVLNAKINRFRSFYSHRSYGLDLFFNYSFEVSLNFAKKTVQVGVLDSAACAYLKSYFVCCFSMNSHFWKLTGNILDVFYKKVHNQNPCIGLVKNEKTVHCCNIFVTTVLTKINIFNKSYFQLTISDSGNLLCPRMFTFLRYVDTC